MLKKFVVFCCCGFLIFIGCGCYDQQIFENTAIILCAGAESGENGKILFSFAAAENENKKGQLELVSMEDTLMAGAIAALNAEVEDPLKAGKIQNLIFSEELAQKGMMLVRDDNRLEESNRFLTDYAITEGSPKKLFKVLEKKEKTSSAYGYLGDLLKNSAEAGLCPNVLQHEFNIDLQTEGIDPVLPLLTYNEEKNTIHILGTALFHKDRYVEKLNTTESRYFSLLLHSARNITIKLNDFHPQGGDVTLNVTDSSMKVKLDTKGDQLYITFDVKSKSYFDASDWAELEQNTNKKSIERKIDAKLEKACTDVVQKIQSAGSDPFGITAGLRGYHNDFYTAHDMDQVYQNAIIKINVHNKLINQKNP